MGALGWLAVGFVWLLAVLALFAFLLVMGSVMQDIRAQKASRRR